MKIYKEGIETLIKNWIQNCEGAMMIANDSDYLYNFAFTIQSQMRKVLDSIEACEKIETLKEVAESFNDQRN